MKRQIANQVFTLSVYKFAARVYTIKYNLISVNRIVIEAQRVFANKVETRTVRLGSH